MNKKSMSVPEMQHILGLGKTESYWLVKKSILKQSWLQEKYEL